MAAPKKSAYLIDHLSPIESLFSRLVNDDRATEATSRRTGCCL